ncbi:hypothetical protein [Rhizobium phage RHph_X2_25]|nr:hypothetical protein [Rhizobium phage RHph_X2_25]
MLHRVVRPFPCSWDGLTLVDLAVGETHDFGNMADGLLAEGYVELIGADPAEEVATVEAVDVQPAEAAPVEVKPEQRRRRGK